MAKAIDVANFFVELANNKDTEMTNLRVNKLIYYAQGWSLARYNKPIFDDAIEAWDYGPVVPEVYRTFKPCGKRQIEDTSDGYDCNVLTSEEIELLLDVNDYYGNFSTDGLLKSTHKDGTPWKKVYKKQENNIIDLNSIKMYFKSKKPLKEFQLPDLTEEEMSLPRNASGILILPKELD